MSILLPIIRRILKQQHNVHLFQPKTININSIIKVVSQLNDLIGFLFYTTNNSENILTYIILYTHFIYQTLKSTHTCTRNFRGNNFDHQRVEIFTAVLTVREFSGGKATLI